MANVPALDLFVQQIGPIAKQLGITELVIVARDPQTSEVHLYGATAAASAKTDMRALVAEKFSLGEGETAWNDV